MLVVTCVEWRVGLGLSINHTSDLRDYEGLFYACSTTTPSTLLLVALRLGWLTKLT
jgi:hypothetical protein